MVQCMQGRRRQHARLAHAAPGHLAHTVGTPNELCRPAQCRTDRRTQPLAEAHRHTVKTLGNAPGFIHHSTTRLRSLCHRRIEQAGTVEVGGQAVVAGQGRGRLHIVKRQQLATQGVFKCQQPGAGKVRIVRLDGGLDVGQRQRAIRLVRNWLGLDAAEHRTATALPAVAMRLLAHQVFVAALAMRQQSAQVALRARRHEQCRLKAQHLGNAVLQGVDCGVIAKHIVTQRSRQHGLPHGGGGLGDRIAAQIDLHHRTRKFFSMAWPCSVRMLSGWNCTPSTSRVLWRMPITSPSSVQAVASRQSGQVLRSMASEW